MEPNKVTITKDIVKLNFPNGRTLEAPKSFFDFVGTELADPKWRLEDLGASKVLPLGKLSFTMSLVIVTLFGSMINSMQK